MSTPFSYDSSSDRRNDPFVAALKLAALASPLAGKYFESNPVLDEKNALAMFGPPPDVLEEEEGDEFIANGVGGLAGGLAGVLSAPLGPWAPLIGTGVGMAANAAADWLASLDDERILGKANRLAAGQQLLAPFMGR